MYQVTPEYSNRQPLPESVHPNAGQRASFSQASSTAYTEQHSAPPSAGGYNGTAEYRYWPATQQQSFAMANQQVDSMHYGVGPSQQHYTPDGALQGIAADDRGLQETWQSFMTKVYISCAITDLTMSLI